MIEQMEEIRDGFSRTRLRGMGDTVGVNRFFGIRLGAWMAGDAEGPARPWGIVFRGRRSKTLPTYLTLPLHLLQSPQVSWGCNNQPSAIF